MSGDQGRGPVTDKRLKVGLDELLKAAELHYITLDGFAPQDLLRPVDSAIREARRLVTIQIEKASLADQERRLVGMEEAIEERKQRIAELQSGTGGGAQ